ncbi:DNA polymerase III subunit delta [Pseudoclostridium thermosuccinogenes]|uniref:DNA polymerase III subunit delta n=1 Tax=Clostridium thermosuccinogenes TaxID=84032 RepID=UPI002FD9D4F7
MRAKEEKNSIEELKADIKNNKIRKAYIFYGPEEYLKKYYLGSIENLLLSKEMEQLNKIVIEGKCEQSKIIEACETMPVFSERKIVLVKNSGLFKASKKQDAGSTKTKGKGSAKNPDEDLVLYIENMPAYTCLIFYEEEIDKRVKLADAVKKNGLIVEFPLQKPVDLAKWVIKVLKSYHKEIDMMTASQLVDNSEQGMTELLNEINKLVSYLGDRVQVSSKDIEEICSKSVKGRIFDLTDAIAEKNTVKAIKLLNDMLILKEPLPKILIMITRQLRQIMEMKLLTASGLTKSQAASKIGLTPYASGKIFKQAEGFTIERLKEAINDSLEMDLAIKTGKINDRIAVELFITEFCENL